MVFGSKSWEEIFKHFNTLVQEGRCHSDDFIDFLDENTGSDDNTQHSEVSRQTQKKSEELMTIEEQAHLWLYGEPSELTVEEQMWNWLK